MKHNRGRRGANGKIPHQWSEEVYMGVCVKVCVRVYELCQISLHPMQVLCLWMVSDSVFSRVSIRNSSFIGSSR